MFNEEIVAGSKCELCERTGIAITVFTGNGFLSTLSREYRLCGRCEELLNLDVCSIDRVCKLSVPYEFEDILKVAKTMFALGMKLVLNHDTHFEADSQGVLKAFADKLEGDS